MWKQKERAIRTLTSEEQVWVEGSTRSPEDRRALNAWKCKETLNNQRQRISAGELLHIRLFVFSWKLFKGYAEV